MSTKTGLSTLAVLLIILGWMYFVSGIGEQIESRCHVNGTGQGSCSFTNTGWTPGSMCVEVKLVNKRGESASSGSICSGRVWPSDTATRDIAIVAPTELCAGELFSAWTDNCSIQVVGIGEGSPRPHLEATEGTARELPRRAGPSTIPSSEEGAVGIGSPSRPETDSTPEAAEQEGPSFDCAKAHSPTEHLICSDPQLATLDVELAALYTQAKAAASDQAAFARESRSEWSRRESTCTDKPCLLEWYAQRRAQLTAYLPTTIAQPAPVNSGSSVGAPDLQRLPAGVSFEACMNFLRSTRKVESTPGEFAEACAPYQQSATPH
jgi:hypothetical protein